MGGASLLIVRKVECFGWGGVSSGSTFVTGSNTVPSDMPRDEGLMNSFGPGKAFGAIAGSSAVLMLRPEMPQCH